MLVEFGAVVGGYGFHASATFERQEGVHDHFCHLLGHFPVRQIADDGEEGAALNERELEVLAFGIGHKVQLPVAETGSVGLRRALLYADAVLDGSVFPRRPAAVLEFEAAVLPQVAALFLVLADIVVDAGLGHHQVALVATQAYNLFWRELLLAHVFLYPVPHLPAHLSRLLEPLFPQIGKLLSLPPRVSALAAVPFQLTANG